MRLILFSVSVLSVLLAGCGSPAKFEWQREGTGKHDTETAMSECRYQIRLNKTSPGEQEELFKLCMQGKGYRLRRLN